MIGTQFTAYAEAVGPLQSHPLCRRCRYDLHGLTASSACPECGLEVWRSLRSDHLNESASNWRVAIALGARVAAVGLLILGAGLSRAAMRDGIDLSVALLLGAGGLFVGTGAWIFSRSEYRAGLWRPGPTFRGMVRALAALVMAGAGLHIMDEVLGHGHVGSAAVYLSLGLFPLLFFVFEHARTLARRGARRNLKKWAGSLQWTAVLGAIGVGVLILRPGLIPFRLTGAVLNEVAWLGVLYCGLALGVLWGVSDLCADVPPTLKHRDLPARAA